MISPAEQFAIDLAEVGGDLEDALAELTTVELAALAYDWEHWWARPEQLIDDDPEMQSHLFLTGRGFGKTRSDCEHVVKEVMAGRARSIGLIAQNEDETWKLLVNGISGLLECSPPWCRADVVSGEVHWANGAKAFVYTPEKPGNIRGNEFDLFLVVSSRQPCAQGVVAG